MVFLIEVIYIIPTFINLDPLLTHNIKFLQKKNMI